MKHEPSIACDLNALDAKQREDRQALSTQVWPMVEEVQDLPDGYAFRFPSEEQLCLKIMAFVMLERRCCPFLSFHLKIQQEGKPLWFHVTGAEGVKASIKQELGISD